MEHHQITYHTVPRETFSGVDHLMEEHRLPFNSFLDQLLWWNKRINLVSRDVSRETIAEHIRHSLLLTQFDSFREAASVIDAGTGGGLPGFPLAITAPEKSFLLNDIVSKKIIAVRQIAQKLGLQNLETSDLSIADMEIPPASLLVSKHAFKLNELWVMTKDKPWHTMVFYKGLHFEEQLEEIDEYLRIDCFDLSNESPFYNGKALICVMRDA